MGESSTSLEKVTNLGIPRSVENKIKYLCLELFSPSSHTYHVLDVTAQAHPRYSMNQASSGSIALES